MEKEKIDPYAILRDLGLNNATSITSVSGGSDTSIWRVEDADKSYALRVFQQGAHDDWSREKQVMLEARAAGLPVPQIYAEGDWHGYPALLLSWIPGRTVADELFSRPWRAWKLGIIFGRMQAMIHAVPAPDVLCQQPDAWITWAGSGEQALQARLLAVSKNARALLHLDYHPFNVMTDGDKITGVLDWRNALAGDPRADAARTVSILRVGIAGRRRLVDTVRRAIFELGWRTGYKQQQGLLTGMSLFYAWAGAVMEYDLARKREPNELARIHRWTARWKRRAGLEMAQASG